MHITNEQEITGAAAAEIRAATKLPQGKFWGAVGSTQSAGCRYEAGTQPMPKAVRLLVYLRYVIGIEYDLMTAEQLLALKSGAAK